ncbi:MAG: RluA family pseudouridine synthase [Leptolyngbyaceae cyanobacterium]
MDETQSQIQSVIPRRIGNACPPAFNGGWIYCDRTTPNLLSCIPQQPVTVLDYYTHHYRHSDRVTWQTRIASGQVFLNNQPITPDAHLNPGQCLSYHRPPWQEPPVPLDIATIYEDDVLLVVNKPSGLPVLPGGNFLQHTLLRQLRQRYPTAAPIHRQGRGTSGIMLLAKTKAARAHLSQQMRQRRLGKTYRALIGPADLPDHFTISHPIGKIPYPHLGDIFAATPDGLQAQSNCSVVQRRTDATLLDVTILTGRPHQIRIHLATMGYPLPGDPLYVAGGQPHPDSTAIPSDCGYWLHAHQLSFIHPTGKAMTLTCEPPPQLLP